MLGFFYALPTLLLVVMAALSTVVGGAWLALLSGLVGEGGGMAAATAGVIVVAVVVLEAATRQVQKAYRPRWAADIVRVARSARVSPDEVGAHAAALGRLAALGVPVPPTLVLTTELGSVLLGAAAKSKDPRALARALPPPARRALGRFLREARGSAVLVKASFAADGDHATYAGILGAARVEMPDLEGVLRAVAEVLASRDTEAVRTYRKRRSLAKALTNAVVLQMELPADVFGTASSRGVEGRTDRVLLDFGRKRSPSRSVQYDLLDGEARGLVSGGAAVETTDWMRQVASIAVLAEEALGGPVQLEYVVVHDALWLQGVRRVIAPPRRSFTCVWPSPLGGKRMPALVHDLRGGLATERDALGAVLLKSGEPEPIAEDEVRYIEGVPYVDFAVQRRSLASVGGALLLGRRWRSLVHLIAPVRRARLPNLLVPQALGRAGWQEVIAWQRQRYLPVVRHFFELATRGALLRAARPLLTAGAHPLVQRLAARRARALRAETARLAKYLEATEARIGDLARGFLAHGAGGWEQMFAGDRHLHLSMAMVEQWFGDDASRAALDAKWRERKTTLAQREDRDPKPRVHVPALGVEEDAPTSSVASLRGVGLVPGLAQGAARVLSKRDAGAGQTGVVVYTEGATDDARAVLGASGVLFLGAGASSAAAVLAIELGIPTVACPDARAGAVAHGSRIALDGAAGAVRL